MAGFEDSDESDSDYDNLQVPYQPPERPLSLINYYVFQNIHSSLNANDLRIQWKEGIGQIERQKWKKKHKKLQKKYEKLLELYMEHNPDFDLNKFNNSPQRNLHKNRNNNNKNRNKKNKKNRNKKRSRSDYIGIVDSSSSHYNNNNQPSRKKQRKNNNNNTIEELFRGINSTKKKRVSAEDFVPEPAQKQEMINLVQSMRHAAQRDWECNKNRSPAINTIRMLDIVVKQLSKKLFYKHYLDETEILEALRDWIHPLPDGSLPSLRIRTELYRIINKFALYEYESQSLEHYLLMSEQKSKDPQYRHDLHPNLKSFARTLMNLWANKKETTSNKNILRKIMERWIRTLTGSDATYGDLHAEMRENQINIKKRYKILQKQKRDFNFGKQKRAKIPEKPWNDFAVAPRPDIDEEQLKLVNQRYARNNPFNDRISKSLKKASQSKQAAVPSVTGKRSHK